VIIVALTAVAFVAATLSGIAGIGGGTLLIAAMYAAGLAPTVVVPVHAAVQMFSNGSRTIAYLKHVHWPALRDFLIGAVPAPFLVAPLIARADADWIRLVMAAFILMTLWPAWLKRLRLEGRAGMIVAGVISGGAGSIIGAVGTLIGPLFVRPGWSRETLIATLAVCQAAGHLLKIIAFGTYGFGIVEHWQLAVPMCLAVIAGSFAGRHAGGKVSDRAWDNAFKVILGVLALKLAWDGFTGLTSGS
jgi:uncharacterized membrane protein YfcA